MKRAMILTILSLMILAIVIGTFYFFTARSSDINEGAPQYPTTYFNAMEEFDIEQIVGGNLATDIVFAPDGRMFYSRVSTGDILVHEDGKSSHYATIERGAIPADISTTNEGERGILSLAIDPDFGDNGNLYAYYTSDGMSRIGRFTDIGGQGQNFTIIFDGIPQGKLHNGAELAFGPDDKLYLSTGDKTDLEKDNSERMHVQDPEMLSGKILRINKDGSIPEDNPFPGTYTYALGFRNTFGFDFNPRTGNIFAAENGVGCCDELNVVEDGGNYGWPLEKGFNTEGSHVQPAHIWEVDNTVAPTRGLFFEGSPYDEGFHGDFFAATWNTREIIRFVVGDKDNITRIESYSFYHFPEDPPEPSITGNVIGDLYRIIEPSPSITGRHAGDIHVQQHPYGGIVSLTQDNDGLLVFSEREGIYRLLPKQ